MIEDIITSNIKKYAEVKKKKLIQPPAWYKDKKNNQEIHNHALELIDSNTNNLEASRSQKRSAQN